MEKFYQQLNTQFVRVTYWESLSALCLLDLNAITGSNNFLVWVMW